MCETCVAASAGRRRILGAGLGLIGAAALRGTPAEAQGAVRAAETPSAALERLAAGNARYLANAPVQRDFSVGRVARASGQAPYAAVLGCADSRVAPELVFDEEPGNLFVVRVAGNFVNDDGMASLEFGAAALGTKAILVLGHTECGAVNATVSALRQSGGEAPPGRIAELIARMKPGIEPALAGGGDVARRALEANVRHAVEKLRTDSPVLSGLIARGELEVRGGLYELATGRVVML